MPLLYSPGGPVARQGITNLPSLFYSPEVGQGEGKWCICPPSSLVFTVHCQALQAECVSSVVSVPGLTFMGGGPQDH